MKSRTYGYRKFLILTILFGGPLLLTAAEPSDEVQPLKATLRVMSQKFCRENEGYGIIQNLDIHVVNQSSEKLIVDRQIFLPGIYVARDLEALAKRVYEYHPIVDGAVEGVQEPTANSPAGNFAILAPGDSYDGAADFWVSVRRPDLPPKGGTLRPGEHVLQLIIATWDYRSNPEEYEKKWEPFGKLIYKPVKTEPFPLDLPTDPKFDKCK